MNISPFLLALFFCLTQVFFAKAEDRVCFKVIVEHPCKDKHTRWYFDRQDKDCRKFWGCPGEDNNFHSKKDCEDKCEDNDNKCKNKVCDDCEKCRDGRCEKDFHNFFCRRRFFPGVRVEERIERFERPPFLPIVVPPLSGPVVVVQPQFDPCANVICGRCQSCQAGECVSDPTCSANACAGITCGECQRCEDGICIQNQGCIVATPPPPPPVDFCAGVTCPECYSCTGGQCVLNPGCRPFGRFGPGFGFDRCQFDFGCGPCRFCANGFCVPRRDGICESRFGRPEVFGRFALERGLQNLGNKIERQANSDERDIRHLEHEIGF